MAAATRIIPIINIIIFTKDKLIYARSGYKKTCCLSPLSPCTWPLIRTLSGIYNKDLLIYTGPFRKKIILSPTAATTIKNCLTLRILAAWTLMIVKRFALNQQKVPTLPGATYG